MSRAFVKEWDDQPPEEPLLERTEPYLISSAGLARLHAERDAETDPRKKAALERRIDAAVVPEPPTDRGKVAFGATVTVAGTPAGESTYTIVGEDEDDVRHGRIAVTSPLAEALLGKRVGQRAVWRRPAGDLPVTVKKIAYD